MELPDTPTLIQRVKELQGEVRQYGDASFKKDTRGSTFSFSKLKEINIYMAIPIGVFILLLLWKPNFVKVDRVDKTKKIVKKFSFKKFMIFWLVFSATLALGVFGIKYKTAQ